MIIENSVKGYFRSHACSKTAKRLTLNVYAENRRFPFLKIPRRASAEVPSDVDLFGDDDRVV